MDSSGHVRITPRRAVSLAATLLVLGAVLWLYLRAQHSSPAWGVVEPSARRLTAGMFPWPERNASSPASRIDAAFDLGHASSSMYWLALDKFATTAFPPPLRRPLVSSLKTYRETHGAAWDIEKVIWQTDKDASSLHKRAVASWRRGETADEGWAATLLTNEGAAAYVDQHFGGSSVQYLYNSLPTGILRSDLLRYLFLLVSGGVYTDTDTIPLQSPSHWGQDPDVHGGVWLSRAHRERLEAGESADAVLGPASVVVGVEADVGDREDWYDWYPRPLQIIQWTMAAAPHHPIALQAVMRIAHQTSTAAAWARAQHDEGVEAPPILSEPKDGGPIGITNWTGPGVWTDAVLAYLLHRYGVTWVELKSLRKPLRVGDVVVLPVTGFSPGVRQFGAGENEDPQAMVWHLFRGSWKTDSPAFNGDFVAAEEWQ